MLRLIISASCWNNDTGKKDEMNNCKFLFHCLDLTISVLIKHGLLLTFGVIFESVTTLHPSFMNEYTFCFIWLESEEVLSTSIGLVFSVVEMVTHVVDSTCVDSVFVVVDTTIPVVDAICIELSLAVMGATFAIVHSVAHVESVVVEVAIIFDVIELSSMELFDVTSEDCECFCFFDLVEPPLFFLFELFCLTIF